MYLVIYIYFLILGILVFILERYYFDNIYNVIFFFEKIVDYEVFVVVNFFYFVQFSILFY